MIDKLFGKLLVFLSAAAIAISPASAASSIHDLQPMGPWKVDYADAACLLSRPFAGSAQTYDFELTAKPIERRSWLRLYSAEKKARQTLDDGDARIEIDGVPSPAKVHFNILPNRKGGTTREFLFDDFQEIGAQTRASLGLSLGRYGSFRLNADDLGEALTALQACVDDLHKSLGIDPTILASIQTQPEGSALSFTTIPERPFDLELLYWVSVDGRVDQCRLIKPTGITEFDLRICRDVMENGRFKPAKNAAGAAVRAPVFEDDAVRTANIISKP